MRRFRSSVLIFTGAVLLAVAALQVTDLLWRRHRAIEMAETRAKNLSSVLSEYVRGRFTLADTSLRQLVVHAQRIGGSSAPSSAWDPILLASRAVLPGSGSVSVTDATGVIRHSTMRAIVGQPRGDRYAFQKLASGSAEELIVDAPLRSPVAPHRWLLPVARRLEKQDGSFDGLVVAVVMPDAFREFFGTVDVGTEGIIWVFHPSGAILFREPSDTNPLGQPAADNPVLQAALKEGTPSVLRGPLLAGGPRFISSYRSLGTPPLVVAVSMSEREILADWRSQLRIAATDFGALAITLGVLLVILFRQMNARARVETELAEVQRLEAIRLRESNERLAGALEREKAARRETEAGSRLKDEFLMTLSHELRTPLNAIVGWVRMLTTGAVGPEKQQQALATIERNANAQARLVEDLLDVSRAISGKLQIEARPVNVPDVVLASVETLRPAIVAKGIAFEADVDTTLAPVLADPDRLQQIVWNLLSNAIKFTSRGGHVQLRVARSGASVEIVVRDSGVGIPPEFLPFVFDRFRQADARLNREYAGLGLGLSIARHLVELHGGTITASSDGPGQGAAFRVLLPAGLERAPAVHD